MHKIIFKELEFRNFMSYGNTKNVFEFRDGLTWLSGDNGFGKSAIVEAMTFALLGVSYRGGKKEELRNTKNANDGAPTMVQLTFDTENPQDGHESWKVLRTISGKSSTVKFTIEKLVGEEWVVQNTRAGFSQQDFEEKILQFNEVLFKNVIAMNTQETLPFFMLPAAKKRELLESIISLSLDSWKKANHSRLSEATISFNVAQSDINQLSAEVDELAKIHQRMRAERAENLDQMKADYQTLSRQYDELTEQSSDLAEEKHKIQSQLIAKRSQLTAEAKVDRDIEQINHQSAQFSLLQSAKNRVANAEYSYNKCVEEHTEYEATMQRVRYEYEVVKANMANRPAERAKVDRQYGIKENEIRLRCEQRDKLTETAKSFKVGTPCPTCGHISDESDVERHKAELRVQWTELNDQVKALKSELVPLQKQLDAFDADEKVDQDNLNQLSPQVLAYQEYWDNERKPLYDGMIAAKHELQRIEDELSGVDIDSLTSRLDELKKEKLKFPQIREEYDELNSSFSDIAKEQGELNGKISQLGDRLGTLKAEIERAENSTDDSIAVMEAKIQKNNDLLTDAKNRMHEASDTIAICNAITKVCADDGMKQMVFSMFVPAFNKAVARNLKRANLPFSVQFTDSMDFIYTPYPGGAPSYKMLSQGQHRKLDFAVAMAFRDFVALIGNFNVNFLSLDEVLDISTDDNAMRDMLDLVKDMLDEIGCAVIITHRGKVVSDKFDFHQAVKNNGLYSMLGPLTETYLNLPRDRPM